MDQTTLPAQWVPLMVNANDGTNEGVCGTLRVFGGPPVENGGNIYIYVMKMRYICIKLYIIYYIYVYIEE